MLEPLVINSTMSGKSEDGKPEYQIGGFGEDVTESTSLGEDSEFIELDYETAAVFKRLADDIYKSTEAGIREPLQNSITAVKRAVRESDLDEDDGIIKIEVQDGEQVKLSLRDNGIGIERSVLREVLAVIGRSQNRDDGELSGKYGMGFLACYKLVGVRGGFLMYSNSRQTNKGPIKGVWKPGGFEMDKGDNIPDKLGSDDYGTLFEFTLKEEVDIESVRNWVERHAKWSRVPILYTEFDEDGKEVHNDEFGDKTLSGHYNDKISLEIDSEHYKAICSPNAKGQTLLINSPIDRNGSNYVDHLGWSFDIRLENENGVIVSGPNEGYQPVDYKRYQNMSEERKEKYIPKSRLKEDDVCLPEPTGTRDTLEQKSKFWSYLSEEFVDEYHNMVADIIEKIEDKDSYIELSDDERRILDDAVDRFSLMYETNKKTKDAFESEFGIDISSELIRVLDISRTTVRHVERGADERKASRKNASVAPKKSAFEVYHSQGSDGVTYMGVSLNQDKMDAVWDDSDYNQVVRITTSSDDYEDFEWLFGWNQLRNVKKNLDEMDVSDDIIERLKNDKGKSTGTSRTKNSDRDVKERHLTVHQNGLSRNGFKAEELKEMYDGGSDYLVLFPSNSDYNLSNHRHIESNHVGIANCIVKVYDYLSEANNIYRIEDWYDYCDDLKYETNKGQITAEEISESEQVLLHVLGEDVIDVFRNDDVMNEMVTVTRDTATHNSDYGIGLNNFNDDMVYVPITPSELDQLRICFDGDNESKVRTLTADINVNELGIGESPVDSDIYWYTWARLPRWRDTTEIETFDNHKWNLNPDWIWLIDELAGTDYEVKSLSGMDILPPEEVLSFHTNDGYQSLNAVTSDYNSAILHILPVSTVNAFRTDGVDDDTLEYVIENADTGGGYNNEVLSEKDYFNKDKVVYIPVTKSEFEDIESTLNNPEDYEYTIGDSRESCSFVAVSGESGVRQINSNLPMFSIDSDTAAYASSRLSDEVKEATIPIDQHDVLPSLSQGGLEFIETLASRR